MQRGWNLHKAPGLQGKACVMRLALDSISKKGGAQTWLHEMRLALPSGAVTVLLGATQAGKTSLMRIMAGLDPPTAGRGAGGGGDATGMPLPPPHPATA